MFLIRLVRTCCVKPKVGASIKIVRDRVNTLAALAAGTMLPDDVVHTTGHRQRFASTLTNLVVVCASAQMTNLLIVPARSGLSNLHPGHAVSLTAVQYRVPIVNIVRTAEDLLVTAINALVDIVLDLRVADDLTRQAANNRSIAASQARIPNPGLELRCLAVLDIALVGAEGCAQTELLLGEALAGGGAEQVVLETAAVARAGEVGTGA